MKNFIELTYSSAEYRIVSDGIEQKLPRSLFIEDAAYFKNQNPNIPIQLPNEISSKSIKTLLLYLEIGEKNFIQHELPSLPWELIFQILILCQTIDFEQLTLITLKFIVEQRLDHENCVSLSLTAYKHLEQQSQHNMSEVTKEWQTLFENSMDKCAIHFAQIKNELCSSGIPDYIIEEIIDRNLRYDRFAFNNKTIDVIEKLCHLRDADNVFQLLQSEKNKVNEAEKQFLSGPRARPSITWGQVNLKGNFYKESEQFAMEGLNWTLALGRFSQTEPNISIYLKSQQAVPKEYFNKDQFFLPSQNQGSQLAYIDDKKDEEQAHYQAPSHCILSFVSSVMCNEEYKFPEPQLECFIVSSKSPNQVKTHSSPDTEPFDLTVKIYLKMKYTISAILTYISFNFDTLYNKPDISYLSKKELLLLMKHKYLNVQNEYQALSGVCLWWKRNPEESLKELLDNINWHYISVENIKQIWRYHPYLRKNQEFISKLKSEILLKANIKDIQEYVSKMKQARRSYQFKQGVDKEPLIGQKYVECLVDVLLSDPDANMNDQALQVQVQSKDQALQNDIVKPQQEVIKPKLVSGAVQCDPIVIQGTDQQIQTIPEFVTDVKSRHRHQPEKTLSLNSNLHQTEDSQIIKTQNSELGQNDPILAQLKSSQQKAISVSGASHVISGLSRYNACDRSSELEKTSIQSNNSLIKGFDKIEKIIDDQCIGPVIGSCASMTGIDFEKIAKVGTKGPKSNYSLDEKQSRAGSVRSRANSYRQAIQNTAANSKRGGTSEKKQKEEEEKQRKLQKEKQIEMLISGLKNVPMPNCGIRGTKNK